MNNSAVKPKQLTLENFGKYGSFVKLSEVSAKNSLRIGKSPIEFFPDLAILNIDGEILGVSICRVFPREFKINLTEHHNYTEEGILPLDGDVLMHVGCPTGDDIPPDEVEVFEVPKLTLVRLKRGVWHHAPFSTGNKAVNCLILLAERTYHNDCEVEEIPEIPIT